MSVRIAVGQAVALLFELARETDEEVRTESIFACLIIENREDLTTATDSLYKTN